MVKQEPDQVVAVRISMVHLAVVDHLAAMAGVNRSEMIRRAVADLITKRINSEPGLAEEIAANDPWSPDVVLMERSTFERLSEVDAMNELYRNTFSRIRDMAATMIASEEEMKSW